MIEFGLVGRGEAEIVVVPFQIPGEHPQKANSDCIPLHYNHVFISFSLQFFLLADQNKIVHAIYPHSNQIDSQDLLQPQTQLSN